MKQLPCQIFRNILIVILATTVADTPVILVLITEKLSVTSFILPGPTQCRIKGRAGPVAY